MNTRHAAAVGSILACAGLAGWGAFAQSQKADLERQRWEYSEIQLTPNQSSEPVLNRMGTEGWELVGVVTACAATPYAPACNYFAYFKRRA